MKSKMQYPMSYRYKSNVTYTLSCNVTYTLGCNVRTFECFVESGRGESSERTHEHEQEEHAWGGREGGKEGVGGREVKGGKKKRGVGGKGRE